MIKKVLEQVTLHWPEVCADPLPSPNSFPDRVKLAVRESWKEFTPSPVQASVAAVDGGMFYRETRGGVIYAVDAEVLVHDETTRVLLEDARVGVLRPGKNGKDVVGAHMSMMELRLASNSLDSADLVLMDGSLKAKLNLLKKDSLNELKVDLTRAIDPVIHAPNVLWISKTSRASSMGLGYPDHYLYEVLTASPGFSDLREVRLGSFFNVTLLESFVRLEKGGPVLKLEWTSGADIKELLSLLTSVPIIRGYPYPLLKVHFDVRFGTEDRETILSTLGLKVDKVADWWPSQFY
ncbi:hypothetical protein HS1genome_0703 [Sulfodiicoccus acidiphilus]|uniref:NurA domain-containing protein n=1 Tax=Sulfodiicoccus acidiphilus TaxID=1670455 RepID=A0A348B2B2_9CREN|nr:DNA double-strand break repair nuclease NurA [Sulfodiicoccus acidiphilus]BBD72314.1 hypothetical protein HS1genome_0703 [Sulfodiicoccus acidiphilus]GGT90330.1 hypothetical protein GCM10007116_05170 [Sulfodiicoccus acidiphilus]